jgi:hypothetical protein
MVTNPAARSMVADGLPDRLTGGARSNGRHGLPDRQARRTVERRTLPAARRRVVFGGIFGTRRTEKSGKTRASRKAAHGRRGIREKTEAARFHWRLFAKSLILQGETRNNARAR